MQVWLKASGKGDLENTRPWGRCRQVHTSFTFKIFATFHNIMFKQAEQIQQSAPASKSMQKSEALEVQLSCKQCGKKYKFYVKLIENEKYRSRYDKR